MKRLRDPNWVLILLFVAIIGTVPIVQTVKELFDSEGMVALDLFGSWPTAENLRAFEHKLEAANWAARVSRPWLQFAHFAWLKEGGEKVIVGEDGWYFFKPGLKYMLARPETGPGTNDPVAAIVDFRDQLAARGIRLVVMPVPNKDSIYPDRLTSRAAALHGVVAPRTREVFEKLKASGVEVIDLFKTFGAARQQSETPLYLAQDTHWSPAGVDLAARTVAQRLVQLGWIQPGSVDYRERPTPVDRLGDILRMLQTPLIEQRVKPERVPCAQVIDPADNKPYADKPNAEIIVIGDSFMRIYQTDKPTSAGFLSHLAKELKQPLMSVVNDGGGATLVREELAGRPRFLEGKKVVVWEFVERDIGLAVKGWPRVRLPSPPPPRSK